MAVTTEETSGKPGFARFVFPQIQDNPHGWGPLEVPEQFKDTPYQPFCKDDRLGKIADWTNNLYQDRRTANKYGTAYGAGGQSQMYVYHHEEDESAFKLVDTTKPQRPMHQKPKRGQMQMKIRRDREKREERKMGGRQQMMLRKTREKERRSKRNYRTYYDRNPPHLRARAPSVDVKANWRVVREIAFSELMKLNYSPGKPEDLYLCGSVGYYDARKEKSVSVKFPQKLARSDKVFHTVTTTDDPVIQKLAKQERDTCKVFATDAILATLMTCTRSRYSWDIVVTRVSDCLFFDKRDESRFEYLSVDETAKEPPQLEEGINSPQRLAVEATYINQALSQQMLMSLPQHPCTLELKEPNPFSENEDETASVVYRYRKYILSDGHGLVVRCAHDSVLPPATRSEPANQFINIKALNEWDPKYSGGNHVDWRMNLDRQRGAVFATELKNNSCKISKWTISAILAGSEFIKFGYVSRVNKTDANSHQILGMQTEIPRKLAVQLGLDVYNAWGILHAIIDYCRELPSGKYLIMKDPNKPLMRIYEIPSDEFESSDDSDDDSDGYQSNDNKSE